LAKSQLEIPIRYFSIADLIKWLLRGKNASPMALP
jgi:hypothetical protein